MKAREATVDYAKRAAELVQCEKRDGYWMACIADRYLADAHGEHAADVVEQIRAWLAAELRAAHDAGVAEGKASERALEMFVVRSVAHEVKDGDDKTAEELIEMLLAERDDAAALVRDAERFVEEVRNVRENLCLGVSMPNAWLDRAKRLTATESRKEAPHAAPAGNPPPSRDGAVHTQETEPGAANEAALGMSRDEAERVAAVLVTVKRDDSVRYPEWAVLVGGRIVGEYGGESASIDVANFVALMWTADIADALMGVG